MSVEQNKAIIRRWNEELINKANLDIVDELAAEDWMSNGTRDREAFKQYAMQITAAFSGLHLTVHDLFAEGDRVCIRWTMTSKHTGAYMGVPPTGKQVTMRGISAYRLAGGKIKEDWAYTNEAELMHQLGILPSPGG
jgi:steroid delta-isomerase-like uncharacterized protein